MVLLLCNYSYPKFPSSPVHLELPSHFPFPVPSLANWVGLYLIDIHMAGDEDDQSVDRINA